MDEEFEQDTMQSDLEAAFDEVMDEEVEEQSEEEEQQQEESEDEEQEESEDYEEEDDDGEDEQEEEGEEEEGGSEQDTQESYGDTEEKEQTSGDESKPPASWKAAAREVWKDVPHAARREIERREQEVRTTLQQTTNLRNFADNFARIIQPYQDAIKQEASTPLEAVQNLFYTANTLRGGTAQEKALEVANIIGRYGVDIATLDDVLASGAADQSRASQEAIDRAVKPWRDRVNQMQTQTTQTADQTRSSVEQEIKAFAEDPAHEFYGDVSNTMADLMDTAARNGRTLSMEEAYKQACQLDPEVKGVLDARDAAEKAKKAASEAKKKKKASKSIKGRSGSGRRRRASTDSPRDDLQADLEAAWTEAESR